MVIWGQFGISCDFSNQFQVPKSNFNFEMVPQLYGNSVTTNCISLIWLSDITELVFHSRMQISRENKKRWVQKIYDWEFSKKRCAIFQQSDTYMNQNASRKFLLGANFSPTIHWQYTYLYTTVTTSFRLSTFEYGDLFKEINFHNSLQLTFGSGTVLQFSKTFVYNACSNPPLLKNPLKMKIETS